MFSGHYDTWTQARVACIKKYCCPSSIYGKKVLELGCGFAHIGNFFSNMGGDVTSSDARKEHLDEVAKLYPHLKLLELDADKDRIQETYDIIVHWGLLYHLKEIENHLENVCAHCNVLFLETEIADSDDENFFLQTKENGYDQAFHGQGIRPSPAYVEKVLKKNGFHFKLIWDPILESELHHYTIPLKNSKTWNHGFRRFWICWKDSHCPLIE